MIQSLDELFEITPDAEEPAQDAYQTPEPALFSSCDQEINLVPLHLIVPNGKNPFKPYKEDRFTALCDSISQHGILQPLILRPLGDNYEIVSGHNRWRAATAIGLIEAPAIVENLNDDEAQIRMVEMNLQHRDNLLPSEKAFAYKMKLDALKHQGARSDLTSSQVGKRLQSMDLVGKESGDSRNQVHRYIRLTELIPTLLDMVDETKIAFSPAYELSFLKPDDQQLVENYLLQEKKKTIDLTLAKELRRLSESELLDKAAIDTLLAEPAAVPKTISLRYSPIKKYFASDATTAQILDTVLKALEQYFAGGSS